MKGYLQSLPVVGKIFLDVKPEEVWAFWRFMQDHFRTSVINKSSALEMQLVARGLEALGVQSKERFLKNFTTTIGRRIYTPFEVGSPKGCLLYTSPSPRDRTRSRMPSSALKKKKQKTQPHLFII